MDASSSASSQHYSQLLNTVSELRSDLERTVSKIYSLEEHNRNLQSNYQTVKEELLETRKKYNEANQNYMATVAEKFESERQNEAFLEKIKIQLADKTKEFEQIRDKFAPQDIDFMRIKVQEELEIPHRLRIQSMEAELEKSKESFYIIRRELERFKAEHDLFSQNQSRLLNSDREEHAAVVHTLRNTLVELQNKQFSPEKDDIIRNQRIRIHELESIVDSLKNEVKNILRERDEMIYNYEHLKSSQGESVLHLKSQQSILHSDNKELEHKIAILTTDIEHRESLLKNARQAAEDISQDLLQYKSLVAEKDNIINHLRDDQLEEVQKLRLSSENERKLLYEQIDVLTNKLKEREDYIRKLHRSNSDLQYRSEIFDSESRRNHLIQLSEYKQKYEQLEHTLSETKSTLKESEGKFTIDIANRTAEVEYLQTELTQLKREKAALQTKILNLDQQIQNDKNIMKTIQQESQLKLSTANNRVKELRHQIQQLEEHLINTTKQFQEAREEVKALHGLEERLTATHTAQWEALQKEIKEKYEALASEYQEKLLATKKKLKHFVAKERKRGDAYKSKAIDAHRRGKALSGAVAAAVGNFPGMSGLEHLIHEAS